MRITGTLQGQRAPLWLRFVFSLCLIVGLFAMHNVVAGDTRPTIEQTPVSAAVQQAGTPVTDHQLNLSQVVSNIHGLATETAGCGGLLMICIAMIIGIGALILLRAKRRDLVLWQLPPPARILLPRFEAPFNKLSPLERSSVLRC